MALHAFGSAGSEGGSTSLTRNSGESDGRAAVAGCDGARAVADSVLYEGYLLYPYRRSSAKNRVRWQFGVLAPPEWVKANIPEDHGVAGSIESSYQQTECLVRAPIETVVNVRLRFLRVACRQPEKLLATGEFAWVDRLHDGTQEHVPFEEATAEEQDITVSLAQLREGAYLKRISRPTWTAAEPVVVAGERIGRIVRRTEALAATVRLTLTDLDPKFPLARLRVRVDNTVSDVSANVERSLALRRSLVATHLLIGTDAGHFLSLLDPPAWAAVAAQECRNIHAFPVLVGSDQRVSVLLSAPIILYDGVAVAPESPGDLHDGTEIDEILSLRTLTLTEAEKAEARRTDPRAAAIIDRVDAMPPEAWHRLHGTIRGQGIDTPGDADAKPLPWWHPGADSDIDPDHDDVLIDGVRVRKGSTVRLRPRERGADAYDIFLAGRTATVARVLTDVDGSQFLAVTVQGDPAGDVQEWYGRTFQFRPDEIEPLANSVLIAGIGNVFLGDDGFGVEVIKHLDRAALPPGVDAADVGIRGVHLAYDLLDGRYDTLVLVDAVPMDEPPGTVAVLRVDQDQAGDGSQVDAHAMTPQAVLSALRSMGGSVDRVFVIGCQPGSLEPGMQFTPAVAAAVSPAVRMVTDLVVELACPSPEVTSDA